MFLYGSLSSKKSIHRLYMSDKNSKRKLRVFNRDQHNRKVPSGIKINRHQSSSKIKKKAGFGHGPPEKNVKNPRNGFIYVDQDTADTYLYISHLGWIDLSSWQPDVGDGPPSKENPPNPITGDQYVDILTGDFYIFTEGFGWVLGSGVEGPPGPQGASFTVDLCTTIGPTGPVISGPLTVEPGRTIQLWIDNGNLFADVI